MAHNKSFNFLYYNITGFVYVTSEKSDSYHRPTMLSNEEKISVLWFCYKMQRSYYPHIHACYRNKKKFKLVLNSQTKVVSITAIHLQNWPRPSGQENHTPGLLKASAAAPVPLLQLTQGENPHPGCGKPDLAWDTEAFFMTIIMV